MRAPPGRVVTPNQARTPCRRWTSEKNRVQRSRERFLTFRLLLRASGEAGGRWTWRKLILRAYAAPNWMLRNAKCYSGRSACCELCFCWSLVDVTGFALHEIHQQVLPEVLRGGEVGFTAAHLRNFLHKIDQRIVGREHEGIDHDVRPLAFVHFLERFADYEWIESEGVFVNAAVLKSQCRRLAIGNHDDLPHVLTLTKQNALCHAQSFARVGIERADLNARQFVQRNFLGAIMEKDKMKRIAGKLGSNQVRQRHGHAFCGRETVLAVKNHAVRTIEHHHSRAR